MNSAIVIACAEGVMKNFDSNLLLINGGYVSFSKQWARHMLHRMGFTKRRANSKVKVPAEQVLFSVVVMEDVPKELIINWDQTGIHYVQVSNWTTEKRE